MKKLPIVFALLMAFACSTPKNTLTQNSPDKELSDSNVLYFVGDQKITEVQMKAIMPEDIESVEVIKDQTKLVKYTKDKIDGVVIITLKKDKNYQK